MQLYPRDLGDKAHIAVVRFRALGTARVQTPPRVGVLGRLWKRGVSVPSNVAAATLPMLADTSLPLTTGIITFLGLGATALTFFGHVPPLPVWGTAAAGMYGAAVAIPHFLFARLHSRPLTHQELEMMKGAATRRLRERERPAPKMPLMRLFQSLKGTVPKRPGDELEQEFWTLAQSVLDTGDVSTTVDAELRGVLRALGNGIAALPPVEPVDSEAATDALTEAETLAARARRDSDPVVTESLLRQADALVEQARALESARRLARRTEILRAELLAQTQAVRALLPSLVRDTHAAANDFSRFASLAASVSSVAGEANSLRAAHEELAAELYPAPFATATAQPEAASLRLQQGTR